jgi:RNA polymerase sporulation-specific sigma factor
MVKTKEERDVFVEQNLGLVHLCVRRFQGRGIEYDDLYSAGCVGLIKSIDAFDEERGVQFSTYAVPVILGEIKRLFRDGGALKVSRGLKELSLKVTRTRERLMKANGREPTVSELAAELQVGEEEIVEAINVSAPPVSLTEQDDESSETRQLDIPAESHEEQIADRLSLKEALGRLEAKDRSLIVLRYFQGKTQVETAKVLGMTQVQVSRREKKILGMMRGELME